MRTGNAAANPVIASAYGQQRGFRAAMAAMMGNIVEWYDFAVYGYFAAIIGKLFFPASDELNSLLLAVGTFGVGFAMRPIGALVLGGYADKHGRKSALLVTIVMMASGTALIGFAPTYDTAGRLAPVFIIAARLMQGFAAGGELGSSTAFLVEHAPKHRKRLFASFQMCSQGAALLIGSLMGAVLTSSLAPAQLESWGWRIPFILGLVIGPIGIYIRKNVEESPEFKVARATRTPISDAMRTHRGEIVKSFGITIAWTVCVYGFLVYMPTYSIRELHFTASQALWSNSIGLIVLTLCTPIFGAIADKTGPRALMLWAATALCIVTYPFFLYLTHNADFATLVAVQAIFALLVAMYTGPAVAMMSELFPTNIRSTGLSIGYNFAVTIFGGFAPFIATWLILATGDNLAPTYYLISACAISLMVLSFLVRPVAIVAARH